MALTYDITKVKNWKSTCYRVVGEKELEQEREWEKTNPKRIKIFNLNRFDEVEAETNEIVIYEMKALNASLKQPAQFTRSVIKQWKSRLKLEL